MKYEDDIGLKSEGHRSLSCVYVPPPARSANNFRVTDDFGSGPDVYTVKCIRIRGTVVFFTVRTTTSTIIIEISFLSSRRKRTGLLFDLTADDVDLILSEGLLCCSLLVVGVGPGALLPMFLCVIGSYWWRLLSVCVASGTRV